MRLALITAILGTLGLTSCATQYMTPANVLWYAAGNTASSGVDENSSYLSGQACATSYLGLIASGDASIRAAAEAGRITNVKNVSHKVQSILGLFASVCTVVRGN